MVEPTAATTPPRQQSNNIQKKRKRPSSADSFTRVAASNSSTTQKTSTSGRGSEAGWTLCPLCGRHSKKMFAQGRGIAAHLHAVHTPWKPGKVERQKRRRLAERTRREAKQAASQQPVVVIVEQATDDVVNSAIDDQYIVVVEEERSETGEPSEEDIDEWNKKVLQIVKELEEQHTAEDALSNEHNQQATIQQTLISTTGVDRNGQTIKAYRASLPPFLQAAADGSIETLKAMITSKKGDHAKILEEVRRTDRHQSTSEHWAAGGGHLACLKFLLETRQRVEHAMLVGNTNNTQVEPGNNQRKVRRRDGKTSLHYAARNGHVHCINYLIREQGHAVDETSGDGTTPFHLACFGGHLEAMHELLDLHGCKASHANDFGCNAAHWLGMTKKGEASDTAIVRTMCRLLQKHGVCFVDRQKQGHTTLHKAAQRQNRHVIEWLAQAGEDGGAGLSEEDKLEAGRPDEGGHTPSQIWKSLGGDEPFANWMQNEMGW